MAHRGERGLKSKTKKRKKSNERFARLRVTNSARPKLIIASPSSVTRPIARLDLVRVNTQVLRNSEDIGRHVSILLDDSNLLWQNSAVRRGDRLVLQDDSVRRRFDALQRRDLLRDRGAVCVFSRVVPRDDSQAVLLVEVLVDRVVRAAVRRADDGGNDTGDLEQRRLEEVDLPVDLIVRQSDEVGVAPGVF